MASSLNSQKCFCLFCYKTIDDPSSSTKITKGSKAVPKFIDLLTSYVKSTNQASSLAVPVEKLKKLSGGGVNLINCCDGCEDKVEQFCELHEQLKVLEMKLDWKLDQLKEEMDYADVLPTRWIQVDRILGDLFQDDLGNKCASRNAITKLRQCVVNAGNQCRKQSLPRVLLQRNNQLDQEAMEITEDAKEQEQKIEDDDNDDLEPNFNKKLTCSKCDKQLKTFPGLKHHLETHKDPSEWKFGCPHCPKRVPTEKELKAHLRVHTGEKPFECGMCGKKYQVRNGLAYHLKNKHGQEAEEGGPQEQLGEEWTIQSNQIGINLSESESTNIKTEVDNDVYILEDADKTVEDLLLQLKAEPEEEDDDDNLVVGDTSGYINEKGQTVFKCGQCDKTYRHRISLKNHLEVHKNPEEWKWRCEKCGKKFAARQFLQTHMLTHQNRRLQCPHCPREFRMQHNFNQHLRKVHFVDIPKGKSGPKPTTLDLDMAEDSVVVTSGSSTSGRVIQCEICTRKFVTLLIKERHFKNCHDLTESSEGEIVKCSEVGCTAYFLNESQLKSHRKLEHGQKTDKAKTAKVVETPNCTRQLACPLCWKMYSTGALFKRHMESHKDRSEWKFECEICGRKFQQKVNLRLHMRTHTKERKYKCKYCGKRYRFVNNLGYHLRTAHRDQQEVKAEIRRIKRKKGEVNGLDEENNVLEVEEICRTDVVEGGEIEIIGNGIEDVIEVDCVNEVMNVVVTEDENIFGDANFVSLDDIY